MDEQFKEIALQFWKQEISKEEFIKVIEKKIGTTTEAIRNLFNNIISNKDSEGIEYGLTLLLVLELDGELIDVLHTLILEPWHTRYEDIIHLIQDLENPSSIPYIKEAMQMKFEYLESYDTGKRQFINQCGHALKDIGTEEALNVIKELSKSDDPVIKDEMLYRLSRISGRNDYERSYDD